MMKFMIKVLLFSMAFFLLYAVVGMSTGKASLFDEPNPNMKIDFSNPTREDAALMGAVGTSALCLPFVSVIGFVLTIGMFRVMASPKTREESNIALGMGETGFGTRMWATRAQKRPGARSEKPKRSIFDKVWNRQVIADVNVAYKELQRGTPLDVLFALDDDPKWNDAVRMAKRYIDRGDVLPWVDHSFLKPIPEDYGRESTAVEEKHAMKVRSQTLTQREKAFLEIAALSARHYDVVRVTLKAQGATPKEIDRVWNCL